MNTKITWLVGGLLALSACTTDMGMQGSGGSKGASSADGAGTSGASGTSGSSAASGSGLWGPQGTTGSTSSPSSPSGSSGASDTGSAGSGATSTTGVSAGWSGVVLAVDPLIRQDALAMGAGGVGAAAAGGAMGQGGSPSDKVYRVTMRADDGTTQTAILESMPSYKTGDRVRYANRS